MALITVALMAVCDEDHEFFEACERRWETIRPETCSSSLLDAFEDFVKEQEMIEAAKYN